MKKILTIIFLLIYVFWFVKILNAYNDTTIETYITWKIVTEKWKPVPNYKFKFKTNNSEGIFFTTEEWFFSIKANIPSNINRDKKEYYYSIQSPYSSWVSFTENTQNVKLQYSLSEGRITKFLWDSQHKSTIVQNKKRVEEYYVPTSWSFFKFSLIIIISCIFFIWIYIRWN